MISRIRPTTAPARPPSLDNRLKRLSRFVQIRRLAPSQRKRRLGVGDRRGDRLVHFMGDRRRELPRRGDPVHVRRLHLRLA